MGAEVFVGTVAVAAAVAGVKVYVEVAPDAALVGVLVGVTETVPVVAELTTTVRRSPNG